MRLFNLQGFEILFEEKLQTKVYGFLLMFGSVRFQIIITGGFR